MSVLRYKGRPADSDAAVLSQGAVAERFRATSVDQAYVDQAVDAQTTDLALKSYIDSQDSLFSTKSTVDTADDKYILASTKDSANGVPSLDASGLVKSTHLPTVRPDRVPTLHGISRWWLSGSTQISSTSETAVRICEVSCPDPGWPFLPLVFGSFLCKSEEFTTFGRIVARGASGGVSVGTLGYAMSTALLEWHSVSVIPYGTYAQGPGSMTGSLTITFYASKYFGGGNQSVSSVNGFASVALMPAL